jgi:hypothetical protein
MRLAVIACMTLNFAASAPAQPNSQPNPYRTVEHWFTLLPEARVMGSSSAVLVAPSGYIWVAERCGANSCAKSDLPPVLEFDRSGKLLRSFGANMFVFPHGIWIEKDGTIWLTDGQGADGKGHQVVHFTPEGKVLMTLGKAGVTGGGPETFNLPSAVAITTNGDIFVSDGHNPGRGNARVLKFSKDGKPIKQWGGHGSGPGQFEVPHCLALDSKGCLFVGDRANNRIQIFDQGGKFLEEWNQFGRPSGIFIDKNDVIYVDRFRIDRSRWVRPQSGMALRHPGRQRPGRHGDSFYSGPVAGSRGDQHVRRNRRGRRGQHLWRGGFAQRPEEVCEEVALGNFRGGMYEELVEPNGGHGRDDGDLVTRQRGCGAANRAAIDTKHLGRGVQECASAEGDPSRRLHGNHGHHVRSPRF